MTVRKGDLLELTCHFDTSERDAPTSEGWGTFDEMCLLTIQAAPRPFVANSYFWGAYYVEGYEAHEESLFKPLQLEDVQASFCATPVHDDVGDLDVFGFTVSRKTRAKFAME